MLSFIFFEKNIGYYWNVIKMLLYWLRNIFIEFVITIVYISYIEVIENID